MDISGFGGPFVFKLVVDVSTNYPNPPTPILDNAPEPVEIDAEIGDGLTQNGGEASVEARVKHWKDVTEIGGVELEAPDLLNDTLPLQYYSYSPYYAASVFKGTLTNDNLAPEGDYDLMIKSWDEETGIGLYDEFMTHVNHASPLDGNLIWAKRAGGTNYDYGTGVTMLSDNSTVVIGYFLGSTTFGLGEPNETILTSAGSLNIFIARYNSDGTLAWAKRAGGPGTGGDYGTGIATLSDNSTVVTGYFYGSATFGLGEPNETVITSTGSLDIFIARYNPDGTLAWAKRAGGIAAAWGLAITTLSDYSTVVTGCFGGSATFGPGESNETVITSAGGGDTFIARYNPDGTLAWAKRAGGIGGEGGNAITTLSNDSTVVTGLFTGSSTFGPGESNETVLNSAGGLSYYDIYIAQYNPDGTLAWAKRAGGLDHDYSNGITTLSDNSTVVTGIFTGSTTFGPGEPNETVLISASVGIGDIFIARYNTDGTLAWAKRAGGRSDDEGKGITALSDNSTVVTGKFAGTATFGPGEPNETILTSAGGFGIFIARYNPDGTLAWAKRAGGSSYGITTLSDNSTVVTGYFYGSTTFGPGEPNETILTSAGNWDIFIARFEP
ncbi:hypothetical protein J7L05_10635 [bacterium]|nr:hypothetical protein [bacterium]